MTVCRTTKLLLDFNLFGGLINGTYRQIRFTINDSKMTKNNFFVSKFKIKNADSQNSPKTIGKHNTEQTMTFYFYHIRP